MCSNQFRITWSLEHNRYYFEDLSSGKSSWSRPQGCTLEMPRQPPSMNSTQRMEPPPPDSTDLPKGWAMTFDRHSWHYYYYRIRCKSDRRWLRPSPSEADEEAPTDEPSRTESKKKLVKAATKAKLIRSGSTESIPVKKVNFYAAAVWDADAFRQRMADDTSPFEDQTTLKALFVEVRKSNQMLLKPPHNIQVPETIAVSYLQCIDALINKEIQEYSDDAQISVSDFSVEGAVNWLGSHDDRRNICCVSECDGTTPGGGYFEGIKTSEADLCRRVPALHASLHAASQKGLYPFGPCQTRSARTDVGNCGNTLFTPNLKIARAGVDEGFPVLYEEQRVSLSVLSVVTPAALKDNLPYGGQVDDGMVSEVLTKAVQAMFLAPVYKNPRCTTLVVGPFGMGSVDAIEVAETFANALLGTLPGSTMPLGKLYHEIHFALPLAERKETSPAEKSTRLPTEEMFSVNDFGTTFRDILRQNGIAFEDLANAEM